jgi:hypothetical protein
MHNARILHKYQVLVLTFQHSKCADPQLNYYKAKSDIAACIGLFVNLLSQLLNTI